jgi:DNA-binding transcriptional MocR family regulator
MDNAPEGISSSDLFDSAIKENVAFVPGKAFYVDGGGSNTLIEPLEVDLSHPH